MAFLSLSKSDPSSRAMLQSAVRARYGLRPVAVDRVRLILEGQGGKLLGIFPMIESVTLMLGGSKERSWKADSKLYGIPVKRETVTLSGDNVSGTTDSAEFLQRLAWAEMAFFLTPLTVEGVTLRALSNNEFEVFQDSAPDIVAQVRLSSDNAVMVQTQHSNRVVLISGQGSIQLLNGFAVPEKIVYQRSGELPQTYKIVGAEANPTANS